MEAPQRKGHFWAKQKLTDWPEEVDIECTRTIDQWEVVQVFENHINDGEPDQWRVFVPGQSQSESIENFFWGYEIKHDDII